MTADGSVGTESATTATEGSIEGEPAATGTAGAPEEIQVEGKSLVAKVKELLHEGNVRRVAVKNAEGHTILEIHSVPRPSGMATTITSPPTMASVKPRSCPTG